MSYEQFWYGEPGLVKIYNQAHELRIEQRNEEMWLQGAYIFRAFRSVAEAFSYGMSGGKGSRPEPYPDRPIPITEREKQAQLEANKKRTLDWVNAHQ